MSHLREDLEWKLRWEERIQAVQSVLGETDPPRVVHPFAWREYVLPGACALTFAPNDCRNDYLYMTLGLSQPLLPSDPGYPWEFAIRAATQCTWPADLLYQLITQFLFSNGDMDYGYYFPLSFLHDNGGRLYAGLADDSTGVKRIGSIHGMYLWVDELGTQFTTSSGGFRLLTVVGVTEDEDRLAQEATPAHLMLLFRILEVTQLCDPTRQSVLKEPGASFEWSKLCDLSEEEVFDALTDN